MNDKELSIETTINHLSSKDSNGLSNIFSLNGSSSSSVQFSLSQRKAAFINEIGVFVVSDDKGTVNGIAPGTEGYMQAALTQSRVIFSSLSEKASAGINFVRQLTFKAGERLGFYLVANNTTTSVDTTSSKTSDNVFFSLSSSNSDKFDHVRVKDNGKSSFDLAWEDLKGGGDKDFNDLVLKMEIVKTPPALGIGLQGGKQGEILDLRSVKGQISANFTVNSDSSNRNHVGFYRINDALGTVTDPLTGKTITPGEVGYAQAAIRQSIVNFNQSSTSSTSIEGGGLFATYIIANGNKEQFLNLNQSNQEGSSPVAYFTYQKANPDKLQHIRQCGDNTFGFEEPEIKGKREYNYTVFKVELSVKAEIKTDTVIDKVSDIDDGSKNTNSDAVVSIGASANKATETGTTGTYTISRSGDTSAELAVNLDIDDSSTVTSNGGGAFGVDYSLSGGNISGTGKTRSIIIPVGMTKVDITLAAIDDTHAEADELLKLNLASGGYSIDTIKNNATVTIAANDTEVINSNDSSSDYTKMEGSLRQALINANAFTGVNDITFNIPDTDPGYNAGMYTITLTSALPDISDDVNINGLGADKLAISGNNAYRVFYLNSGINATFDRLRIANGSSGLGAAIYNSGGTLTITNSTISDNKSGATGCIHNDSGILTVANSTISGNSASAGSGIFNGGILTVTNSTISGNSASGSGGGIYNAVGTLTVTNSTISGNSISGSTGSGIGGGGIFTSGGTLTITNSTISGNSLSGFSGSGSGGGGIYNSGGTLTVTNSTISGNSLSGSSTYSGGGIFNRPDGTFNAKNTIIAKNIASSKPDFSGTLTSQGYNLIGNNSGTTISGDTTGNILNVDPLLGLLQDNGGPTYTMALLNDSSPAINAGDPNFTSPQTTDQRGTGFNRVIGGRIDIGAYESDLIPT